MPAGEGAVGVPENLGVVVGMQVNEAGSHDETFGVDHPVGGAAVEAADLDDSTILDCDVADVPRGTGAVHDGAAPNDNVVMRHHPLLRLMDRCCPGLFGKSKPR